MSTVKILQFPSGFTPPFVFDSEQQTLVPNTQEVIHQESLSLDEWKAHRNKAIDTRTQELIEAGFVYDSVVFSGSETAQRNWMAMDQARNDITYPFGVSTKDDGEHTLDDAADVHTFFLTGLATFEAHYASGRVLKQQVNVATNIEEVDAVVDNR